MKTFAACAVLILCIFSTASSVVRAGTFAIFGPETFARSKGAPVTVVRDFQIQRPGSGYLLRLHNGGEDFTGVRVSSAVIVLNGSVVVAPSDLNQQATLIERPIVLGSTNQLSVELRGKPGGIVAIEILGVDDDLPTIVPIAQPSSNANGWNNTAVTVSFECSDPTSGVASCSEPVAVSHEGTHVITGTVVDLAGNTSQATVTVRVDTTPPSVVGTVSPEPNASGWHQDDVTVDFLCADALSGVAECPDSVVIADEGEAQSIARSASDLAGNVANASLVVNLDRTPPNITITSPMDGTVVSTSAVTVGASVQDTISGISEVTCNGVAVMLAGLDILCELDLLEGLNAIELTALDLAGNESSSSISLTYTPDGPGPGDGGLPPDPSTVAPDLDTTVATTIGAATEFLYTGANPIQRDVAPGTIEPVRAAVVRGRVLDRGSAPLPGVRITLDERPELGNTLSRTDGVFDMSVNGGGYLTVRYEKEGFITSKRRLQVPWQRYVTAPDVVLVERDSEVTEVGFAVGAEAQVARGSVQIDEDGERQATLFFPEGGNMVDLVFPDGSILPAQSSLNIRLTELTVGPDGPAAMPLDLPGTSAYTYAVELDADEAIAAGAEQVLFGTPVSLYVENFLGFPVGIPVPVGSLSAGQTVLDGCNIRTRQPSWVPEDNGVVLEIVSETSGLADVDVDGDGVPNTGATLEALGLTDAEREKLAALYEPGESLWRARISHFSAIDLNYPIRRPGGGGRGGPPPSPDTEDSSSEGDCEGVGSILGCQSQTLAERIPLTGTALRLHYQSSRVSGRSAAYTLNIPVSGETVSTDLLRIDLEIHIAGRIFEQSFPPSPNQSTTYSWDGMDAYGRLVQGAQPIEVIVKRIVPQFYGVPANVARSFGLTCFGTNGSGREACEIPTSVTSRARSEQAVSSAWSGTLGSLSPSTAGWNFNVHHSYDVNSGILHRGDGTTRTASAREATIETVFGPEPGIFHVEGLSVGPDGSVYFGTARTVRRILPDGTLTTFAGDDTRGIVDCVAATEGQLAQATQVELGDDGSVFFVDAWQGPFSLLGNRIRKVGPDGILRTFAGNGERIIDISLGADGVPATEAKLLSPSDIALGPDGSVYISVNGEYRVRRVSPDGIIMTVAGNGDGTGSTPLGDGGPATQASVDLPRGIDVAEDGSLYIAEPRRVRRVGPDGIITTVAGDGTQTSGTLDDDGVATDSPVFPQEVTVAADGSIYLVEPNNHRVRVVRPDGIIRTIAGNGTRGFSGDGGPATAAQLLAPRDVAIAPNGDVYISDSGNGRVRVLSSSLPGFTLFERSVTSTDGAEIYVFDPEGRHLRTLDGHTSGLLWTFGYDVDGFLVTLTDQNGGVTLVERSADGSPQAVVGPFGQRTALSTEPSGYLASITNPAGGSYQFTYSTGGLMTTSTDPRGNPHRFTYDDLGRLIQDEDPAGGFQELVRTDLDGGYQVTKTTVTGASTTYSVIETNLGSKERANTFPGDGVNRMTVQTDGIRELRRPDGSVITLRADPDPRWGMQAPLPGQFTVSTPLGLSRVSTLERSVSLANSTNPFSLQTLNDVLTVNGRRFTRTYDALQRISTSTSPEARSSSITLDDLGRVIRSQRGGLTPLSLEYGASGRPIRFTAGGRSIAMTLDGSGELASMTDALSQTTTFDRDPAGRVFRITRADGSAIEYGYDASGNRVSVTPPGRPSHLSTYTPFGKLQDYLAPDVGDGAGPLSYTYDADRRLQRIALADGRIVDRSYDAAGRLETVVHPRGTIQHHYGAQSGRLIQITSPGGVDLQLERDGHLITAQTWTGPVQGVVRDGYDTNFHLISRRVGSQPATPFLYDRDGRIVQAGGMVVQRDPQHGLVAGTSLGGVSTESTYNGFAELETFTSSFAGTTLYSASYAYDDAGRIGQVTESVEGVTTAREYTYDTLGRLVEVHTDGVLTTTYAYDENGNRLSRTDGTGVEIGSYDAQDRLRSFGDLSFGYALSGELVRRTVVSTGDSVSYDYDALGNLLTVGLADGRVIDYLVDGLGRRVGKRIDGALTGGYLYQDRLNPAAELDGAGNMSSLFVFATRQNAPDYIVRNGRAYRVLVDHLGSPRLVVDSVLGTVAQRLDYDEFGRVRLDTNPAFQPFGYAGGLYDPDTGLVRFGVRDYDSEVGRFVAKDPALFAGGTNFYAYVGNDPLNRRDDLGLEEDAALTPDSPGATSSLCSQDPNCVDLGEPAPAAPGELVDACMNNPLLPGIITPSDMDKLACYQLESDNDGKFKDLEKKINEKASKFAVDHDKLEASFIEFFGMTFAEACRNSPRP